MTLRDNTKNDGNCRTCTLLGHSRKSQFMFNIKNTPFSLFLIFFFFTGGNICTVIFPLPRYKTPANHTCMLPIHYEYITIMLLLMNL